MITLLIYIFGGMSDASPPTPLQPPTPSDMDTEVGLQVCSLNWPSLLSYYYYLDNRVSPEWLGQ